MIGIGVLLLAFSGFSALCAAMARHQPELLGRRLPASACLTLRRGGGGVLLAALGLAVWRLGAGIGAVYWFGAAMISSLILTVLIPYRPSWAGPAGLVAAGAAVLLVCTHLVLEWSGRF